MLLTFALVTLGGVVHNTESSLACPDWPLCFGQVMPEMEGGVAIEHSHRLLATLVVLGVLLLVLGIVRFGEDTITIIIVFATMIVAVASLIRSSLGY